MRKAGKLWNYTGFFPSFYKNDVAQLGNCKHNFYFPLLSTLTRYKSVIDTWKAGTLKKWPGNWERQRLCQWWDMQLPSTHKTNEHPVRPVRPWGPRISVQHFPLYSHRLEVRNGLVKGHQHPKGMQPKWMHVCQKNRVEEIMDGIILWNKKRKQLMRASKKLQHLNTLEASAHSRAANQ